MTIDDFMEKQMPAADFLAEKPASGARLYRLESI